jgi:hypothetical protein
LNIGQRGVKSGLQSRQGYVYDCAVDERHTRAEDRRGQNPWSIHSGGVRASTATDCGFVAGRPGNTGHPSIFRRIARPLNWKSRHYSAAPEGKSLKQSRQRSAQRSQHLKAANFAGGNKRSRQC